MKIKSVLKESFDLLYKEPKLFVPRLVTTALYTIVMIYMAKMSSYMVGAFGGVPESEISLIDPGIPASFLADLVTLILLLVLLLLVDLVSYAMYPPLIRDHHSKKPLRLVNSFKDALAAWKTLFTLFFLIIFFAFAGGIFVSFSQLISLFTGAYLIYVSSILIMLVGSLILMVALFFVVPVAVIERKGLMETFNEGFRLSFRHKKDLFALNVFFMALTFTTFLLMMLSEMNYSGIVAASSILLFVLARSFQAVIYTYISVVNPYFYMKIR
ncbi:MAG: hypothetical protein JW724_00545 [Candidatus Altiarchaeota archaeon]|nr:hypothetical protein [Candidatus Altiarchaeota archaeon]